MVGGRDPQEPVGSTCSRKVGVDPVMPAQSDRKPDGQPRGAQIDGSCAVRPERI
jgi:hypothetical protein